MIVRTANLKLASVSLREAASGKYHLQPANNETMDRLKTMPSDFEAGEILSQVLASNGLGDN